jgi:TatD DNase family protein
LTKVPFEQLVLETDSPYLAPVPKRGKRNESGYLQYVLNEVARLSGKTSQEVEQLTDENARRLFA